MTNSRSSAPRLLTHATSLMAILVGGTVKSIAACRKELIFSEY